MFAHKRVTFLAALGAGILLVGPLHGLKIDRVIVSSDAKPMYLDFWPIVAKAWQQRIGIKPTLVFIGSKHHPVNERCGEVIRVEPIKGVPISQQAQVIRLLAPMLYPDEVCITSDVDMLPISRKFFVDSLVSVPDDHMVIHGGRPDSFRWPMCYFVAKGKLFREILGIDPNESFESVIRRWHAIGWGWNTDELVMANALRNWDGFDSRISWGYKLDRPTRHRLDRARWRYDPKKVKVGYYTEAHLIRPYKMYKRSIDRLCKLLGIK